MRWQMVERRTDKLMEQFVEPYRIKRIISLNAVELELLAAVKIYPVVNISRIHRYKDQVEGQKVVPFPLVGIEDEKEYKVEKILNKRRKYGKIKYLVQWKGYMAEGNTWEKVESLGNAQDMLKDYERGYEEMARRIREEENGTYRRRKLLEKYIAKLLYG